MEVSVAREAEMDLDEKQIQEAFEKDLSSLEEGLRYVASFVQIGAGIIDTLAVDADNNPVIIEYKKQGAFDKDALIQLMDYYSWFASDPNHFLVLKSIIQKKLKGIENIGQDIWLIAVVSDVEDRVKNACWSLKPPIRLVTYGIFNHGEGKFGLLPKVILDTAEESERLIVTPKSEDDHLREHEQFRTVYLELKKRILALGEDIRIGSTQDYISFSRRRSFCGIHFKRKWIRPDILAGRGAVQNPRYKPYPSSDWGYVHLETMNQIDDELMSWVKIAYEKAG